MLTRPDVDLRRRPVLFMSPPGGFPGLANLGLEIVADSVQKKTGVACDVLRSDLFLCRHVHPAVLNKVAHLDAMDFFFVASVFPEFARRQQVERRDAYLKANGLTESERRALLNALQKLGRHFEGLLSERDPAVLAVSVNSDRLITALHFARVAKGLNPAIRVLFGGPVLEGERGASVFSACPEINYLVHGRGECVAPELIRRVYASEPTETLAGPLLSRGANGIVHHAATAADASPYPLPEMEAHYEDLVRLTERYGRDAFEALYGIVVALSAGCWWSRCDFCSESRARQRYVIEDCEVVARYIRRVSRRHHISDVFFVDSIQPPAAYLRKLCGLLTRHSIPYRLSGEVHASIDDETFDWLLRSGYATVQAGVESYSQGLLDRMRKGIRLIDLLHLLTRCKVRQVAVQGNLIMYHPLESAEDVAETRRVLALTSHLFVPFLQHYFVAHGSALAERLRSTGPRTYTLRRHRLLYPRRMRERLVFSYRYLPENRATRSGWTRIRRDIRSMQIRPRSLVYVEGKDSIQVIDRRDHKPRSYSLSGVDRDLLLRCSVPKTLPEAVSGFPDDLSLAAGERLARLVSLGIVIQVEGRYLTLAVPWQQSGQAFV